MVLVTATPELLSYVEDQGGSVFVHIQKNRIGRGVGFLHASTKEPRSLGGYELFVVDEMLVLTRFPAGSRPKELHLSMESRRKKHPIASWDGCAFMV